MGMIRHLRAGKPLFESAEQSQNQWCVGYQLNKCPILRVFAVAWERQAGEQIAIDTLNKQLKKSLKKPSPKQVDARSNCY